jgi:uncharacterized membrane protein
MQGEPGGPGVKTSTGIQTQTANKPVIEDSKDTFSLRTPAMSTTLKQGETKSVSIALSRGSEFKDDVQVSFSGVPAGVKVTPATAKLGAQEKELKIDIAAEPEAEAGEFSIIVKGHSDKGGPDSINHLKLTVAAK